MYKEEYHEIKLVLGHSNHVYLLGIGETYLILSLRIDFSPSNLLMWYCSVDFFFSFYDDGILWAISLGSYYLVYQTQFARLITKAHGMVVKHVSINVVVGFIRLK